jgi:hypothetical protein
MKRSRVGALGLMLLGGNAFTNSLNTGVAEVEQVSSPSGTGSSSLPPISHGLFSGIPLTVAAS